MIVSKEKFNGIISKIAFRKVSTCKSYSSKKPISFLGPCYKRKVASEQVCERILEKDNEQTCERVKPWFTGI